MTSIGMYEDKGSEHVASGGKLTYIEKYLSFNRYPVTRMASQD